MDNKIVKALLERRSCRSYEKRQIADEDLKAILEAGMMAPSAMNRQDTKIIVLQNPDEIKKLSKMNAAIMGNTNDPFYGAPTVIIVLAERSSHTAVEDGSLVIGNMMNAAHALGLGSCWIHRAYEEFESEEGREMLTRWGVKGSWRGVGHCIVGYPIETKGAAPRKEDFITYVN